MRARAATRSGRGHGRGGGEADERKRGRAESSDREQRATHPIKSFDIPKACLYVFWVMSDVLVGRARRGVQDERACARLSKVRLPVEAIP